jgi:hydrogenase maturation protein HypF
MARDLGLSGEVFNDSRGVLIRVAGAEEVVEAFLERVKRQPPPLGRVDRLETRPFVGALSNPFRILASVSGAIHTQIAPDAAICPACAAEIIDPFERRFRYPFTNCTHCGPRLSLVTAIPFDRGNTTMAPFPMCPACAAEYGDPADRRFHAEAVACHACGPAARLIRFDGRACAFDQHSTLDAVDAACGLIQKGEIVAIKGLGGYQLACDATREDTVARLRRLKHREAKPFALMARDLEIVRDHCEVDETEARLLTSAESPIVLLAATGNGRMANGVAPGLATLGFMLPTTPLHALLLRRMGRPVVMTSGNLSSEPQVIDDAEALERLAGLATYGLVHDRQIASRVDDSVVRVVGDRPRLLRRARGYAPSPIPLPPGFAAAPDLLAMGGELKAAFCVVKDGEAILSQHQGDLENAETLRDYRQTLSLYAGLFEHTPAALIVDRHPEYLSSKLARERARREALPLVEVQHHHAHVAACLAENARPLDAPPVLGIVLDGLGWGGDDTLWGGEFLLADYRGYERLGTFKPVAMLGGAQAAREPWRNLYAHLMAEMGWADFTMNYAELDIHADLAARPRAILESMARSNLNAPLASSCGRLFDAVAAALGICTDVQAYEGEAASRLEAIVDDRVLREEDDALAYPLSIPMLRDAGLPYIEPLGMWRAILGDLILKTPGAVIAARFHKGLAKVLAAMAVKLAARQDGRGPRFDTVALSGGCFQNRVLFEEVTRRLGRAGFTILSHEEVPANDGGLALGQAAIGAAHLMDAMSVQSKGTLPCA